MSLHVEWLATRYMTSDVVPSGSQIGENCVDPGNVAVVLWGDEAVVIEGPKAALQRRLSRMLEQLEAVEATDAIPPNYVPTD